MFERSCLKNDSAPCGRSLEKVRPFEMLVFQESGLDRQGQARGIHVGALHERCTKDIPARTAVAYQPKLRRPETNARASWDFIIE